MSLHTFLEAVDDEMDGSGLVKPYPRPVVKVLGLRMGRGIAGYSEELVGRFWRMTGPPAREIRIPRLDFNQTPIGYAVPHVWHRQVNWEFYSTLEDADWVAATQGYKNWPLVIFEDPVQVESDLWILPFMERSHHDSPYMLALDSLLQYVRPG